MRNILLIGGMGSGKTTLANALMNEDPTFNYVYMSKYAVRIPMTLIATARPDTLSLPKPEYFKTIFENKDIGLIDFSRQEMDRFVERVSHSYGDLAIAELALHALAPDVQNIVDNIPKVANVRYLKEKGLYVVGMYCKDETQVQRRLKDKKSIDPLDKSTFERQVTQTNRFFEVDATLRLADVIYDTDMLEIKDYPSTARGIIKAAQ